MLRAYQEAEIIAAREAACKGYAIEQATPEGWQGSDEDAQGRQIDPVEPGMGLRMNPGEKYVTIDPNHPVQAFGEFCKSVLRSIASGMGVSYTSLSNDLEGVNYSSIRAGLLEEREEWKTTQEWFINSVNVPIFEDWLAWCLTMGMLEPYTMADFDRLNHVTWTPRRWPWVDPEKDVNSSIKAIGARLTSRDKVISEMGGSIEEVDEDFDADPVTSDLDTESVYCPDSKEVEPQDTEPANGNENGNGNGAPRWGVDGSKFLNGKGH